ncbi:hypothetical protein E2C01_037561 [Portunus trituberculatus]|uniref:Uncharacterized protein n=1 Tax=Portunus trituberculatus TaxID=210409 RepID=A0A5B7FEA6_PORTR|nr:hypothetical protein [Portunus trituberculatus]
MTAAQLGIPSERLTRGGSEVFRLAVHSHSGNSAKLNWNRTSMNSLSHVEVVRYGTPSASYQQSLVTKMAAVVPYTSQRRSTSRSRILRFGSIDNYLKRKIK